MSAVPNHIDNPELFDTITLGGKVSPGKATLSGHDRKATWDVKTGNGQSGASTTLKDIPPIEFQCTFLLIRDDAEGIDDLAAWPEFQAVIDATVSGSAPKAVDIYHPDLASQDPPIKSVCKATVGGATYDDKGAKTIVVKFQEYRPASAKGGSVNGSSSKGGKSAGEQDPNADVKAQLNNLTNQYQNTPWQ